jgi:hypothetical protein
MNIKKKSSKCKEFEYYITPGERSRECTSVAEHSTADREVGESNKPAPFDFQI